MKMRQFNHREKNFAVVTVVASLMIIAWGNSSRTARQKAQVDEELVIAEDKLNQTKTLLESAMSAAQLSRAKNTVTKAGVPVVIVDRKATLHFLRDITSPEMADKVKVLSAEKRGDAGYTLVIEAEFTELMRFMSFLERKEGKFVLEKASIHKSEDGKEGQQAAVAQLSNKGPNRKVTATFQLNMKG